MTTPTGYRPHGPKKFQSDMTLSSERLPSEPVCARCGVPLIEEWDFVAGTLQATGIYRSSCANCGAPAKTKKKQFADPDGK